MKYITSTSIPCVASAFFWLLIASSNFGSILADEVVAPKDPLVPSGPQINQDRKVDFDYCYVALDRHDDNGDKRFTQEEFFLDFCQDVGGRAECLGQLTELPVELLAVRSMEPT